MATTPSTTVIPSVSVLSTSVVSVSLPVTVTVLLIVPTPVGVPMIVTVAVAPGASVPIAQVTVPPAGEHVPCVEEADPNAKPEGMTSVTVTPVAVIGPALVTTIVKVIVDERLAGLGEPDFVTERFPIVGIGVFVGVAVGVFVGV